MTIRRRPALVATGLLVLLITSLRAQDQTIPADLKPLLAAPQSEMRMVVQRYTLDRTTLSGNYANGGGRGRGGGGRGRGANAPDPSAPPPPPPVPVSPARIARLKRFDLAGRPRWQLDAAKLTPAAKTDLDALNATIPANLKALDAETLSMAQALVAAPFAPKLVQLVEARIRVEDIDCAACRGATITEVIEGNRAARRAPPPVNQDQAARGAAAVDQLRAITTEWFTFYNGYDPMFTWWMGSPISASTRRSRLYAACCARRWLPRTSPCPPRRRPAPPIAPARRRRSTTDVPDLNEIIALPQDEMRDIVRASAVGAVATAGVGQRPRRRVLPRLARGAAVARLRQAVAERAGRLPLHPPHAPKRRSPARSLKLDPNPPRKDRHTGIPGPARGREGLIQDLSEAMIPYTPEQLIALAEKEFAWCDAGDDEGLARDGLRRRLEEGAREDQGRARRRPASSRG